MVVRPNAEGANRLLDSSTPPGANLARSTTDGWVGLPMIESMLQVLLKVWDSAGRWNCSQDYIYRRLNPSRPQFIPHKRLPSGDVRFDEQELVGYLKSTDKQVRVPISGSSVREGIRMTRNRNRKGSLLLRGHKRKLWLVQGPEGDRLWHQMRSR